MKFKVFAGVIGAALLIMFIGPVVLKLKEVALSIVSLIGITMMIVDIWQALRSKED